MIAEKIDIKDKVHRNETDLSKTEKKIPDYTKMINSLTDNREEHGQLSEQQTEGLQNRFQRVKADIHKCGQRITALKSAIKNDEKELKRLDDTTLVVYWSCHVYNGLINRIFLEHPNYSGIPFISVKQTPDNCCTEIRSDPENGVYKATFKWLDFGKIGVDIHVETCNTPGVKYAIDQVRSKINKTRAESDTLYSNKDLLEEEETALIASRERGSLCR